AFAIDEHEDSVTVHFNDLTTGRPQHVRACYVVGCDGARSLVRQLLRTDMEDIGRRERWLVIDTILKREKPELGDWTLQHCNPARPATYVRGIGQRRRWEIMQLPDDDADTFATENNVWRLLRPWIT